MIDQDIRDALKVEPSPEFMARVRTRIASERAPSAWRWSWTPAAAGALAAAAIVAVTWSPIETRPDRFGPGLQTKPSAQEAGPKGHSLEASKPAASLTERRPGPFPDVRRPGPFPDVRRPGPFPDVRRPGPFGPGRTIASRDAAGPKGPALQQRSVVPGFSRTGAARQTEILVDNAEMRALQALIAGVRDGRIALAAAQTSVPLAAMELAPVADIVIDPIIIEPIAPPSGAEGVRP